MPLYDLHVAGRRTFWVAACAGLIVFGTLMGAMFIGQQYLQNVLGYSTVEAGAAILPAAVMMVLIAPRSAKLVEARGARFTLLVGYACCLLGFLTMLVLWDEGQSYWAVGLGYALVGAGVGFAGTPASHSLTGSVPVTRAGMASGTADLQRDLGGAIMQSILGALLTAGYASAVAAAIADAPNAAEITDSVQTQLQKSFASAEDAPSSTRSTPTRSPPRRPRRSSTAPTGPTSPGSSPSCSGRRSSSSSSRGDEEQPCSPSTTPRTRPRVPGHRRGIAGVPPPPALSDLRGQRLARNRRRAARASQE